MHFFIFFLRVIVFFVLYGITQLLQIYNDLTLRRDEKSVLVTVQNSTFFNI